MKFRNWYQKLLYRMNIDSSNLKKYDIYHKVDEDCVVQTTSGAFLSLFGWVLILILVYAELNDYVHPRSTEHMGVDTTLGRKLRVNFNISFHALTCAQVHMDAMDVSGDNQIDVEHDLVKRRLNQRGDVVGPPVTSQVGRSSPEQLEHAKTLHRTYAYPARMESGSSGTGDNLTASVPVYVCGDCYGAANALNGIRCCNTCEDLKAAYRLRHWPLEPILRNASQCLRDIHNPWNQVRPDEGCRISGALWVNKLAGNLHVAIGESSVRDGMHVHSFAPEEAPAFNISHTIHAFSFGESLGLPGALAGRCRHISQALGTGLLQYFLKVVSIEQTIHGRWWWSAPLKEPSYSYVLTERFRSIRSSQHQRVLPGVFFVYDLTPFLVHQSLFQPGLMHIFTRLCAIVGGVFSLLGYLDSLIYRWTIRLHKEID